MKTPMTPATEQDEERRAGLSRRRFLVTTGAVAAGATLFAACGGDDDGDATSSGSGTADDGDGNDSGGNGDAAIAATAASLEVLAVNTYKAALDAATAGKLGAVPPAVATYVQTAMAHHQSALDGWNGVLTSAGAAAVSDPPADLKKVVDAEFAKVTDVVGAAKLALLLEKTAADTYLAAVPKLKDKTAITTAGRLQTLDQEHVAVLLFVLGEYPVPLTFQTTENGYSPSGATADG